MILDFGSPVAQNVNVNPQQGLQTLSSLLGLKQQQIGIQQAQQQLQSQTAEATVAKITAQQTQNLSQINWHQYIKPDGSYDIDSAEQAALQAAPNIGPQFVSRLADMSQSGVALKKSLYGLNQNYQDTVRATQGTWGADPKATPSDLATQLEAIEENAPDSAKTPMRGIIDNTLKLLSGPQLLTGAPKGLAQQKAEAVGFARAGLSPESVGGAGGIATPAAGTANTGTAIIPTATNRETGITSAANAPPVARVGLAPTLVTQPGTGAPAIASGTGQVQPLGQNAAPAAGGAGAAPQKTNWWQPAPGQVSLLNANTAAIASRIQAGEQAANTSPTAIDALNRARSILDNGTWTGGTFSATKDLRNLVSGLGVDTTSAQNASELAKNLARYEAARAGSVGSTDAARSLYEAGAPNTKMDAAAVKAVVMQSLGIEKMIQGYAKAVGGAPTPQAAMQAEQKFRSIPNLVQTYELGFMRSKPEADEFFKRYGVSGRDLAKSADELRQMGAL